MGSTLPPDGHAGDAANDNHNPSAKVIPLRGHPHVIAADLAARALAFARENLPPVKNADSTEENGVRDAIAEVFGATVYSAAARAHACGMAWPEMPRPSRAAMVCAEVVASFERQLPESTSPENTMDMLALLSQLALAFIGTGSSDV